MLQFHTLLVILAAVLLPVIRGDTVDSEVCDHTELWCKNETIATKCQVLKYCKLLWSMNNKKTEKEGSPTAQPIKVSLYFESLCPGCRQFFLTQMYPTFQKLASTGILQVELVPYGNANEYPYGSSWQFYCQHGAAECTGNIIETCGINIIGDPKKYMPFIHCLETYQPTTSNVQYCSSGLGIDYQQILSCASSSQGIQMEHQMALKTQALNPPHQYVPWITVNDYHTDQIQNAVQSNMLQYVCNAYQGAKPAVCSQTTTHKDVCYKA